MLPNIRMRVMPALLPKPFDVDLEQMQADIDANALATANLQEDVDADVTRIDGDIAALEASTDARLTSAEADIVILQNTQPAGYKGYANFAAMEADTSQPENTIAELASDGRKFVFLSGVWAPAVNYTVEAQDYGLAHYDLDTLTWNALTTSARMAGTTHPHTASDSFSGYATTFTVIGGFSFNVVSLPIIRQLTSIVNGQIVLTTAEADLPAYIVLEVRETNSAGALLGTSTTRIDRSVVWKGGIDLPAGVAYEAVGTSTVWVGVWGLTKTFGFAHFGRSTAQETPQFAVSSEVRALNGTWSTYPVDAAGSLAAIELNQGGALSVERGRRIQAMVEPTGKETWLLSLPSTMYSTQGIEFNLYFDQVFTPKRGSLVWDARWQATDLGYGLLMKECFRIPATQTVPPGSYTLTVRGLDPVTGKPVVTGTTTIIHSAANTGAGEAVPVVIIGDSNTAAARNLAPLYAYGWTEQLLDTAEGNGPLIDPVLELKGTQGTAPYLHEGRGGWTYSLYYLDPASPFCFGGGAFNFPVYESTNSIGAIRYVFFALGLNDVRGSGNFNGYGASQAGTLRSRIQFMINSIKTHDSNIRVVIIPPHIGSLSQDAWGNNYRTAQQQDLHRRQYIAFKRILRNRFDSAGRRAEGIYWLDASLSIDPHHNMIWGPPEPANAAIEYFMGPDGTYAQIMADTASPVGTLRRATDMEVGIPAYPGKLILCKRTPPGVADWDPARPEDGVERKQKDALHPLGPGNYQFAMPVLSFIKYDSTI